MTSTVEARPEAAMAEVSLRIEGMTCGACAARIAQRLNALDGVEAQVNFATERATVLVAPDVPVQRLLDTVAGAGYAAHAQTVATPPGDDQAEADRRVRSLRNRLIVSVLLFMPLCDLALGVAMAPNLRFPGWQWLMLTLAAPVVTWAAWPFYQAAFRAARHGLSTMDTLVSLGIVSSCGWSLYAMFWGPIDRHSQSIWSLLSHRTAGGTYLDVAAGVTTFLLAGRLFEAWSRRRSGSALRALAAVGAKDVAVVAPDGTEHRRPVAELAVGDHFVVRPGETVATDGRVLSGHSAIDRSILTGEFQPLSVGPGDNVVGGTISVGGRLIVQATEVGGRTQLAEMIRMVEHAQNEKAGVQRLADRVSNVFVPAVLSIALVTLAAWLLLGYPADQAFTAALAVLVIACPCALGLATPAALYVASGEGARSGIFFKGYRALEASRSIDTVILDKTGTITEGRMAVTDLACAPGVERAALLRFAGGLEQASEHPVATAVVACARAEIGSLPDVRSFVTSPGQGVQGTVEGRHVTIGRQGPDGSPTGAAGSMDAACARWEQEGRTVVRVAVDGAPVGAIALADTIRESAAAAVRRLRDLGLRCVLMTGDNEATARAVADAIGISEVLAGALPAEKVARIRALQAEGRAVAMVGDGVNDGPALVVADLGLAVGSGTDVALNAADLIVVRDDLRTVATAINLSRRTLRVIHANLVWACAYNLAAIPLAALGFLNPLLAAATMAFSSGFVVWNSSRLRARRRTKPQGRSSVRPARRQPLASGAGTPA